MLRWRTAVGATALALGLAACGGSSSGGTSALSTQNQPSSSTAASPDMGTQDTIAGHAANDHGTKDVSGQSSVAITANDYYFQPSVLQGTPGQKLTLSIKNLTTNDHHNFTVKSQHVDSDLDPGKTVTVHVTLPASGVVSFYCECHQSEGMAGGLLTSGDKAGSAPASTQSSSSSTETGWG